MTLSDFYDFYLEKYETFVSDTIYEYFQGEYPEYFFAKKNGKIECYPIDGLYAIYFDGDKAINFPSHHPSKSVSRTLLIRCEKFFKKAARCKAIVYAIWNIDGVSYNMDMEEATNKGFFIHENDVL